MSEVAGLLSSAPMGTFDAQGNYTPRQVTEDNMVGTDLSNVVGDTILEFDDGDLVKGTVVKIDRDEVLLDIGFKSEGVIPSRELSIRNDVNPSEIVSLGEQIEALVLQKEDKEGRPLRTIVAPSVGWSPRTGWRFYDGKELIYENGSVAAYHSRNGKRPRNFRGRSMRWAGVDSNHRRQSSRQIYSLFPLATRATPQAVEIYTPKERPQRPGTTQIRCCRQCWTTRNVQPRTFSTSRNRSTTAASASPRRRRDSSEAVSYTRYSRNAVFHAKA